MTAPGLTGFGAFSAWRVAAFLALFTLLSLGWAALAGGDAHFWVIERLTVAPAAQLLGWLDPALGVSAQGDHLKAAGGGLRVAGGCEGMDIALLMVSGVLCAEVGWRHRLVGLVVGSGLVFAMNQMRIVGLFYAFRHDRAQFDLLHTVVMPLAMVLVLGAFFFGWLGRLGRRAGQGGAAA